MHCFIDLLPHVKERTATLYFVHHALANTNLRSLEITGAVAAPMLTMIAATASLYLQIWKTWQPGLAVAYNLVALIGWILTLMRWAPDIYVTGIYEREVETQIKTPKIVAVIGGCAIGIL